MNMDREKYNRIAKAFSYWELCYLEDALANYSPKSDTNKEKEKVRELTENIRAARGWVHQFSKVER